MNDQQRDFLRGAAAAKANHPFPEMTAAEAALESNWGNSELARAGNNFFGMKQHSHPIFGTLNLPTHEWTDPDGHPIDGRWVVVLASWVKYPDLASCFADRLATLQRLSNAYPHYKAALNAPNPETYIAEVSKSWSTDPNRAAKVLSIFQKFTKEQNSDSKS